jgi:prepilin-type N-terminal cleavage/methylation domain-containing protein
MIMKLREVLAWEEGEQGFTLVELIVVMAILAIVAALAVPKFSDVLADSKTKASAVNIEMITRAAELYAANEEDAATKLEGLIDGDHVLIDYGYLREVPRDPVSNKKYMLKVTKDNGKITKLEVTVTGEATEEETEG